MEARLRTGLPCPPKVPLAGAPYDAHPLLDPFFPRREPGQARLWVRMHRSLTRTGTGVHDLFTRPAGPRGRSTDLEAIVAACLGDVDRYLDDLLCFAPPEVREHLSPLADTRMTNDPAGLLQRCFSAAGARPRYEAQRKLYLGRLLFSIDHWRAVRDGPRHQAILEDLLERSLFRQARRDEEAEVCYRFIPDGAAAGQLLKTTGADERARCWRFHPRTLPAGNGRPAIEIFHHQCRFKRDPSPAGPDCPQVGPHVVHEQQSRLGRRSGSILSKMLRKGITDPHGIQDVLGAMFVVADRRQARALEQHILESVGGPTWTRDRTDTLAGERDRGRMSKWSAAGFEVLKETMDILVDDPVAGPYQFGVELQIYPLASYIATVHHAHRASHEAYKQRQVRHDLLPLLFPAAIFDK